MHLEKHARVGVMLRNAAAMAMGLSRVQPLKRHGRSVDVMSHGARVSNDMGRGVVVMAIGSSVTSSFVASKVRTDVA
jgi:hypothetical protein